MKRVQFSEQSVKPQCFSLRLQALEAKLIKPQLSLNRATFLKAQLFKTFREKREIKNIIPASWWKGFQSRHTLYLSVRKSGTTLSLYGSNFYYFLHL